LAKFGIGQAVRRVEDQRFLTGRGRYVDDIALPRQCHGVALLSPHAHARIKSVDAGKARTAPGVLAVLTGADAAAEHLGAFTAVLMPEDVGAPKGFRTHQPLLATDRVRFVGDRVAYVVAETAAQARDALDLIEVDYEPLPAVVDLDDAAGEGAAKIWEDNAQGNTAFRLMFGKKEAADAAFAQAKHVVKLRLENNRLAPASIEPRAAIGDYNVADDSYTLYTTSQNPHGCRLELSHVFHVPESRVRVVAPDVGGGFGMKGSPGPDDALVLWASRRVGRPVRWASTRAEAMLTDTGGRDQVVYGEMALDGRGKILGIRARSLNAVGGYFVGPALVMSAFALRFIPEAYDVQAIHVTAQGLFTNTAPLGPYRGAGRPEAAYLTERLLDQAAREMQIDPAAIRRRNLLPPSKLPYATPTMYTYDSGEFEKVMDRCLELADWKGYGKRKEESERRKKLRGRAVTFYIEQGGIFNERMDLRFDPGGSLTIVAGTHSHGQGHATVFAQLASEFLGVPFESITYVQGDTAAVPFGRGTYAARSSLVGGNALKAASEKIVERAKLMAAAMMEASAGDIEFKEGNFSIVGTDKKLHITDVAKAFYAPAGLTDRLGVGLEASGTYGTNPPNHPNGCHVCEVEVDPETGAAAVERYAVVDDLGRVLNPMIVEGQIHGGVAQGIGQALMEHALYERGSGQLVAGSFMDYAMPRASDFPPFAVALEEIPCKTNPLGVKGIGESGTIGAPPTVMNALLDALAPLGVRHLDMPATPQRVWRAIESSRSRGGDNA
jgi:carbon-monoxide dehydrogenase large subunit